MTQHTHTEAEYLTLEHMVRKMRTWGGALLDGLGIHSACILTQTTICFNDQLTQGPFREFATPEEMGMLVKALLDAGVPVKGYWKKIDYQKVFDERVGAGERV